MRSLAALCVALACPSSGGLPRPPGHFALAQRAGATSDLYLSDPARHYPYETAGKMVEILVSSSQGGAGTLEKGHRGAIFPGKFPETENLKGGHISRRISGNVRLSQTICQFVRLLGAQKRFCFRRTIVRLV